MTASLPLLCIRELSVHVLSSSAMPPGQKGRLTVQLWKRNLTIRDDSGSSVEITFWGQYAQDPGDMLQEVCSCPTFVLQDLHPLL